jgi:hypothetical protein
LVLSLAAKSKAAGQLAAKQAERAKLTQITLPNAYRPLGKHIHGAGSFRADFQNIALVRSPKCFPVEHFGVFLAACGS